MELVEGFAHGEAAVGDLGELVVVVEDGGGEVGDVFAGHVAHHAFGLLDDVEEGFDVLDAGVELGVVVGLGGGLPGVVEGLLVGVGLGYSGGGVLHMTDGGAGPTIGGGGVGCEGVGLGSGHGRRDRLALEGGAEGASRS